MLERLGNVLFWVGIIIAIGWLAFSYVALSTREGQHPLDVADLLTVIVIPILSVAIGWTLRYILAGPK
jgi:hypothetical protein